MDARCPHCQTIFRVDPAKVPLAGVRARCNVCSGVFFVGAESPATQRVAVPPPSMPPPPPPRRSSIPAAPPPPPAVARPAGRSAAPQGAASGLAPAAPPVTPFGAPRPDRAAPPPPPAAAFARPVNPFLAQDPATKARRLARALISDLVVYHPAKRADGLRDGSLKILFEDEIRKCWEEYTDQVGMEMATTTLFFTEALNEILADGRTVFP